MLLGSCSKSVDKDDDAPGGPSKEAGVPLPGGLPGVVKLDRQTQQRLQLKAEPLKAIAVVPELKGYGHVLDPTPLAELVTEWATAQASATASAQESARVRALQEGNNASLRALQAAEAATTRDRLLVQSTRQRIALAWGIAVSDRPDLPSLVRDLTSQHRVIARIDLPAGEEIAGSPGAARLIGLADESHSMPAAFLGLAPTTDPQMQSEGLLYLTRDNSLRLPARASVIGYLAQAGSPLRGVLVPQSALLRYAGATWIYLQSDESTFRRVAVMLTHPVEGGWLAVDGLKPGDRAVTDGAQLLLSTELSGQLSLGD